MAAENIPAVQQAATLVARATQFAPPQSDSQKGTSKNSEGNVIGSDQITLNITTSRQTLDEMQRLDGMADDLNATAKNIRETGNGLKLSADIVAKMKGELDKIIKNYPPFSIDDGDRKKILMSYISIRKEINSLTVPLLPTPIHEKVEGMWQELFPQKDGKIATPALKENSSDNAVKIAANKLSVTGDAISQMLSAVKTSL
jgi:hypothetical protein